MHQCRESGPHFLRSNTAKIRLKRIQELKSLRPRMSERTYRVKTMYSGPPVRSQNLRMRFASDRPHHCQAPRGAPEKRPDVRLAEHRSRNKLLPMCDWAGRPLWTEAKEGYRDISKLEPRQPSLVLQRGCCGVDVLRCVRAGEFCDQSGP